MNKPELKSCPFCGKRPILKADDRYPRPERERITAYEVVCDNSDCIIYRADNVYFRTEQEAIDKWNRRAEQAGEWLTGEWLEDEFGYCRCSLCGYEHDQPETTTPYCPNCGAKME